MKINVWIEVTPWDIGNDGNFKTVPFVGTTPFTYPCSSDIKRFKATIEIPYEMMPSPVEELGTLKADQL